MAVCCTAYMKTDDTNNRIWPNPPALLCRLGKADCWPCQAFGWARCSSPELSVRYLQTCQQLAMGGRTTGGAIRKGVFGLGLLIAVARIRPVCSASTIQVVCGVFGLVGHSPTESTGAPTGRSVTTWIRYIEQWMSCISTKMGFPSPSAPSPRLRFCPTVSRWIRKVESGLRSGTVVGSCD